MRIPNKQLEIDKRRERVATLYLRGIPQWKISVELKVDQATVSRDIAAIRKQWRDSALYKFNQRMSEELAKIDNLERMYFEGWQSSCDYKGVPDGVPLPPEADRLNRKDGNPEYLKGVQWCIEARVRLMIVGKVKRDYRKIKEHLKATQGIKRPKV